jgi:hypothetical protein
VPDDQVGLDVWNDAHGRQVLEEAVRSVAEARRTLLTNYPTDASWLTKARRRILATRAASLDGNTSTGEPRSTE